jgi:hypothetical protein
MISIPEVVEIVVQGTKSTQHDQKREDQEIKHRLGGARHGIDGDQSNEVPDDGNTKL